MAEIPTPPRASVPTQRIAGMGTPVQPGVGPRVQTSVDAPAARDNLPAAIGGARESVQLISALDGFVQSIEAASQEMRNSVKEMHRVADQIHRYTEDSRTPPPPVPQVAHVPGVAAQGVVRGGDGGSVGGMSQQAFAQLLGQVAGRTYAGLGLAAPGQFVGAEDDITAEARRDNQREQHRARVPRAPRPRGPVTTPFDPEREERHGVPLPDPTEAQGHASYERSVDSFNRGRNVSVADIRQKGSQWAMRHLQNRQAGVQQRLGHEMADRGLTRLDFGGNEPAFTKVPVKTPGIVDIKPASAGEVGEAIPGLVKEGGMLSKGAGVLEGLGAGEGAGALAGLLPEAAAGPAGWAMGIGTLAYTGANMIGGQIAGQRAQNARFQSIEGGSNFSGFAERGRQRGFGLSQLGTMSGEEANRLFMGVTETGLKGGQRQGALDFASREYRKLGMSIDESVKLIQVASENGETSFGRLGHAIEGVSQAAHQAGTNADLARQKFINTYQSLAGTFGGQGAIGVAQAETSAFTRQGHLLANVDTAGQFSEQQLRVLASRAPRGPGGARMTPMQLIAMQSTQQGQTQLAEWRQGANQNVTQHLLGPRGNQALAQTMSQLGVRRGQNLNEEQRGRLRESIAANLRFQDPRALHDYIQQQAGLDLNPQQALDWIVGNATGTLDIGKEARNQAAATRQHAVGRGTDPNAGGANNLYNVGRRIGLSREEAAMGTGQIQEKLAQTTGGEHDRLAYRLSAAKSGQTSPLVESLLSKGQYDPSLRYVVDTGKGQRVVNAGELVSKFGDQAATGKVRVMKDGADVGSLAEHMHMQGDEGVQVKSSGLKGKGLKGVGEDIGKYQREHGGDKGGGHITVSPTPELQKWLNFMTAGGGAPSARSGTIPPQRSTQPGFGTSGQ